MGSLTRDPAETTHSTRPEEDQNSLGCADGHKEPGITSTPTVIRLDDNVAVFVQACETLIDQYASNRDNIQEDQAEFEKEFQIFADALTVLAIKYGVFTTDIKGAAARGNAKADVYIKLAECTRSACKKYVMGSTFGKRALVKPRGYAGDYDMIRMLYRAQVEEREDTNIAGQCIDHMLFTSHAGKGVRLRRKLVKDVVMKTLRQAKESTQNRKTNIISIGCGPCEEIFDVMTEAESLATGDSQPLMRFIGLDIDQEAIEEVKQAMAETPQSQRQTCEMVLHKVNVIRLVHAHATNQDLRPQDAELLNPMKNSVDIIYSLGLIDYFEDEQVVALLNWIHSILLPDGGTAIIGNFAPKHSLHGFLDFVLDWRLMCRSESDLIKLCQRSACAKDCHVHVHKEDNNDAQLFLMIQRKKQEI